MTDDEFHQQKLEQELAGASNDELLFLINYMTARIGKILDLLQERLSDKSI